MRHRSRLASSEASHCGPCYKPINYDKQEEIGRLQRCIDSYTDRHLWWLQPDSVSTRYEESVVRRASINAIHRVVQIIVAAGAVVG